MKAFKVLFFASDPEPTSVIGLDRHVRAIEAALNQGSTYGRLLLRPRMAVTEQDITEALLAESEARIVHFAMHGSAAGLKISAEDGRQETLSLKTLRMMLACAPDLRLAVFNVCQGEQLAEAMVDTVPCSIGARGMVETGIARVFGAGLYLALAHGRSIGEAFEVGRARAEHLRAGGGDDFSIYSTNAAALAHRFAPSAMSSLPEIDIRPVPVDDESVVDIFVTAPPSEEEAGRTLCMGLEATVFFAPMSLLPGDSVDRSVRQAMQTARMFVVISSGIAEDDWYHQDSIQQAVHLIRGTKTQCKRIIPVYLTGDSQTAEAEFGLRRIQGIYGAREGGIPGVVRVLNTLYDRLYRHIETNQREPSVDGTVQVSREQLVRWFASCYQTRAEVRELWRRGGGDPGNIPIIDQPRVLWSTLLARVDDGGEVSFDSLIDIALTDYPNNPLLRNARRNGRRSQN